MNPIPSLHFGGVIIEEKTYPSKGERSFEISVSPRIPRGVHYRESVGYTRGGQLLSSAPSAKADELDVFVMGEKHLETPASSPFNYDECAYRLEGYFRPDGFGTKVSRKAEVEADTFARVVQDAVMPEEKKQLLLALIEEKRVNGESASWGEYRHDPPSKVPVSEYEVQRWIEEEGIDPAKIEREADGRVYGQQIHFWQGLNFLYHAPDVEAPDAEVTEPPRNSVADMAAKMEADASLAQLNFLRLLEEAEAAKAANQPARLQYAEDDLIEQGRVVMTSLDPKLQAVVLHGLKRLGLERAHAFYEKLLREEQQG